MIKALTEQPICAFCQHWRLESGKTAPNGDPLPHGMAKHRAGYCDLGVSWVYIDGRKLCGNGRFKPLNTAKQVERQKWLEAYLPAGQFTRPAVVASNKKR